MAFALKFGGVGAISHGGTFPVRNKSNSLGLELQQLLGSDNFRVRNPGFEMGGLEIRAEWMLIGKESGTNFCLVSSVFRGFGRVFTFFLLISLA